MPTSKATDNDTDWHLDKRVPISLIATIMAQTIAGIWWASALNERVAQHDRQISALIAQDQVSTHEMRRVSDLLARVEERLAATSTALGRVEVALNRTARIGER